MTIWDIALVVLFAVAMAHIILISKKMDKILNLMQNKPIDHKEDKKKKEQD